MRTDFLNIVGYWTFGTILVVYGTTYLSLMLGSPMLSIYDTLTVLTLMFTPFLGLMFLLYSVFCMITPTRIKMPERKRRVRTAWTSDDD